MIHIMDNGELIVTVSDTGAEIVSVKRSDCEYIWQGDPQFWADHAPFMFPICGRLFEGKYKLDGKIYDMNLHGFARRMKFEPLVLESNCSEFVLTSTPETKAQYPFDFELFIRYKLVGNRIITQAEIKNLGNSVMPATFGAHPGFNVPLDCGSFSDWYIEFSEECSPDRVLLSDSCLNTGKREALPLENGKILRLEHTLFDNDAIFMARMADEVTLRSARSSREVSLKYSDMPYLGIWHKPHTAAPYVCIEPWCGLPAYDGEYDDMNLKNDMFRIIPRSKKELSFELSFK